MQPLQSVSSITTFFLAAVLHPDVQKKAQEEIDRVVGKDRLPSYTDRPNLPYVEAVMREALRWHPPVSLSMYPSTGLHTKRVSSVHEQPSATPSRTMSMPATSSPKARRSSSISGRLTAAMPCRKVLCLHSDHFHRAMLHNEEAFPDHTAFRPERWFGVEATKDIDPLAIAFGFGRRYARRSKQRAYCLSSLPSRSVENAPVKRWLLSWCSPPSSAFLPLLTSRKLATLTGKRSPLRKSTRLDLSSMCPFGMRPSKEVSNRFSSK